MYTLYYSPGACSLATQVVLYELDQEVKILDKNHVDNFKLINFAETVPVLVDGENILKEGAAIILHLLNKHQDVANKISMFPVKTKAKQKAIQDIMFANATMHPAYGRLFFLSKNISDEKAQQELLNSAATAINQLWQVVERELTSKKFLGGESPSAADIMLAVYSTWGNYFPVNITLGTQTTVMLNTIQAMPNFQKAIKAEQIESAKLIKG